MKLPFIKYIQARFAAKHDFQSILTDLAVMGVPLSDKITEEIGRQIYNSLVKSDPDYYSLKTSTPDINVLRNLHIEKMTLNYLNLASSADTAGLEGANQILLDKEMYIIISSMALAKITQEDIELLIAGKYNIHYTKDDINEFLNYYFNVHSWSIGDKKLYLKYITDKRVLSAYTLALEGDKDYLLWKLGIAPEKSFDQMLHDMTADAYYFFKEKAKVAPEEAQKWGTLVLKLTDKVNQLDEERSAKRTLFDEINFTIAERAKQITKDSALDQDPLSASITTDAPETFMHIEDLNKNV